MSIHKRKLHAIGAVLLATLARPVVGQYAPQSAPWTATFGALALLVPRYEGADEHRLLAVPFIQMTFRDRLYLGPSTSGVGGVVAVVGATVVRRENAGISAEVGLGDTRPASRSDALAGTNDRAMVASIGSTVSYRFSGIDGAVTARHGLGGEAGALLGARLGASKRFGRMMIRAGINAVLADAREMRRAFGVTEEEAALRQSLIDAGDSRLRRDDGSSYRPGAGLKLVGATASGQYAISKQWSLIGFGSASRLGNEAVRSPLVRRRDQFSIGIGLGRQVRWGSDK